MASVVIVDDDPDIVTLFKEFITLKGHTIIGNASDGIEAIDFLKNCDSFPDVIFMDHRMPRMSGLEASKIILDLFPSSNIIFISADLGVKEEAIANGAKLFLVKPISFRQIGEILDNLK